MNDHDSLRTDPRAMRELAPPVMEVLRKPGGPLRALVFLVAGLFLNAIVWPSWAVAMEAGRLQEEKDAANWEARNQQLDQVLKNLRDTLREKNKIMRKRLVEESDWLEQALSWVGLSAITLEDTAEVTRLAERVSALRAGAIREFDEQGARLTEKKLPQHIHDRHTQARDRLVQHFDVMQARLERLVTAETLAAQQNAAAELAEQLGGVTLQKPRDPFDPNNLPWGTPDPSLTPEPADSADALSARTGLPLYEQGAQLASNAITPDMLGNPGGPTQADLDATPDIQLTDAIRAKAAALNDDPVQIYQWVRNNIEFIPSYGSIQGADYTLQNGKGNAFDTASLLIALLRAASIPARYAFGTVEVPADKAMNWVGNVQTPEAAGNLLGQGGIPHTGLLSGGQISQFRMEHVWVEAWIDYFPSRGAKHVAGDSWIALDASFKQYDYTDGMALDQQVPFDAQALADTIQQQSTVNEAEGWVQGVPQADIETALTDYRSQLESFLENQAPDATVGEVLGTQQIKTVVREQLAAGLPYELVTRKLVTSALPDTLRWKFKYQLSTYDLGAPGASLLTIEQPTVALAGQKLALSFKPATQDDEQTLASFLPEPDENGDINPEDIPDTLPGYLINLTGEFSIGNAVAATASKSQAMGTELHSEMGYWQPGRGWQTSRNYPIAGEYRAVALDLQGISAAQAQALQTDLAATQAKLDAADYTDLTKQQLVGDLLYSTILSYFALNNVQDRIAERQANSVGYRSPSYGLFKTSLTPRYWYGIPQSVKTDGLGMDVDRFINQRVDRHNNTQNWIAFNRAQGARMSAMEHLVPEQMFSTEQAPAQGISTVKAIQLAAAEGQRIYTITQANLNVALQQIDLPQEIEDEIRNAVGAGMEVVTHQKYIGSGLPVLAGYIVTDPQSGGAGYRIGMGENGGLVKFIGLAAEIFGYWIGVKAELFKRLGGSVAEVASIARTLTSFFALIGITLDIIELTSACGHKGTVYLLVMLLGYLGPLLGLIFLAAAAPFLIGIIAAVVIAQASRWFKEQIKESCNRYP